MVEDGVDIAVTDLVRLLRRLGDHVVGGQDQVGANQEAGALERRIHRRPIGVADDQVDGADSAFPQVQLLAQRTQPQRLRPAGDGALLDHAILATRLPLGELGAQRRLRHAVVEHVVRPSPTEQGPEQPRQVVAVALHHLRDCFVIVLPRVFHATLAQGFEVLDQLLGDDDFSQDRGGHVLDDEIGPDALNVGMLLHLAQQHPIRSDWLDHGRPPRLRGQLTATV